MEKNNAYPSKSIQSLAIVIVVIGVMGGVGQISAVDLVSGIMAIIGSLITGWLIMLWSKTVAVNEAIRDQIGRLVDRGNVEEL